MSLKERFESERQNKTFRRIDDKHNLDWFIGYNEDDKKQLVLVTCGVLSKVESTKFIISKLEKRIDDKLSLSFTLIDNEYEDIYYKFCEDMIEITRDSDSNSNVLDFVLMRWNMWRLTFKNNNKNLTENEVKGVIGELLFLKEVMVPKYGLEKSIMAWQGPLNYHKDFEINNEWYEIKTVSDNSSTLKINSIQQLEDFSNKTGELCLVVLTNTNIENDMHITLNKLVNLVDRIIVDMKLKRVFWEKMNRLGYIFDIEYDNYIYELNNIYRYDVSNDRFPKIVSKDLKRGIVNVSYEISISELKEFIIGE